MVKRTDFSEMECSVARTLEVVGERWALLVIRDAFYGLKRFDDFQRDLGVARNVLTDRLAKLVQHGVLERRRYEDRPPRYEYRLTQKGKDLFPVLLTMMHWGDKWMAEGPAPVKMRHASCGEDTHAVVTCSECGEELKLGSLIPHPILVRGAAGSSIA